MAHNAEPHLEEVLASWAAELGRRERDFEILVLDDGSTDRTAERAEALTARFPQARLLRHEARRGPAEALRTGIPVARFPLLLTCPCDRQFRAESLGELLTHIDEVHLATGYRVWQPVPLLLRVLGWFYRTFLRFALLHQTEPLPGWLGWDGWAAHFRARACFGVRIRDVGCPFRLYRRALFERLPIQSDGAFALTEVLAKANFLECVMTEAPVPCAPPGAVPQAAEARRQERADFWRVFGHPEFLPSPPAPASPPPNGEPPAESTGPDSHTGPLI